MSFLASFIEECYLSLKKVGSQSSQLQQFYHLDYFPLINWKYLFNKIKNKFGLIILKFN